MIPSEKKTGKAGKYSGLALAIFATLTAVPLFLITAAFLFGFLVIFIDAVVYGNGHPIFTNRSEWIWLYFPILMPIAIIVVIFGVWKSYLNQQFGRIKLFVLFGTAYGAAAIPGTGLLFSYELPI